MKYSEELLSRFWDKVDKRNPTECWEWTAARNGTNEYGRIWDGKRTVYAHRLSWRIHNGEIPEGYYVLHSCDNPPCVNPNHLRIGTCADNLQEMHDKGRGYVHFRECQIKGEDHPNAKLNAKKVIEIRKKHSAGRSMYSLAKEYDVDPKQISNVVKREQWSHVP